MAFRRGVSVVGAVACLAPVALSWCGLAGGLPLSDAGLATVLVLLGLNWLLCRHAESGQPWPAVPALAFGPVAGMVSVAAAAWFLGLLLVRLRYLPQAPLTELPRLAVHLAAFYPDVFLHKLRLLFFSEYSARLVPSPAWYGCLCLEAALPGKTLAVASQTVEGGWRALQGTRQSRGRNTDTRSARTTTAVRLGLAVVLLGALAWSALRLRPLDGPVTRSLAREFAGVLVVFLPVLALLIRLTRPFFRCRPRESRGPSLSTKG
jgi:hypothetical protein